MCRTQPPAELWTASASRGLRPNPASDAYQIHLRRQDLYLGPVERRPQWTSEQMTLPVVGTADGSRTFLRVRRRRTLRTATANRSANRNSEGGTLMKRRWKAALAALGGLILLASARPLRAQDASIISKQTTLWVDRRTGQIFIRPGRGREPITFSADEQEIERQVEERTQQRTQDAVRAAVAQTEAQQRYDNAELQSRSIRSNPPGPAMSAISRSSSGSARWHIWTTASIRTPVSGLNSSRT
jgi:hypothetical protein